MSAWELIYDDLPGDRLERLPVPGGWIYRSWFHAHAASAPAGMVIVFVPTPPDHPADNPGIVPALELERMKAKMEAQAEQNRAYQRDRSIQTFVGR